MIFVNGFVHCDPHPGNILVRRSPKHEVEIVFLDHGLYQVRWIWMNSFPWVKTTLRLEDVYCCWALDVSPKQIYWDLLISREKDSLKLLRCLVMRTTCFRLGSTSHAMDSWHPPLANSPPNPNPFSGFHIITGMSGMVWLVPLPVDTVARLSSSVLQDVAVPNQLRPGRYKAKQWSIRSKGDVWSAGLYTDSEIMGCCYNWYWPRTYYWWGGMLSEDTWLFFFSSNVFYTLNKYDNYFNTTEK